ncbi:F-box protein [Aspergillus candidus]|uniref:F-box domain-containing protein n=1 Tax=Aspergillus candidus TaxID=41067 RepID=A0A2I2F7D5_ASPCN|nr:hypothetical protein BDW47DRAFT_48318 [Aspergillus candidus]PLB36536.1 hypothetical protein BDW47DRAFT_48318 [Aspergillus candidus]
MGYSEIYCHLCGVSFNIVRSRKLGEPDFAQWDYTGHQSNLGVDEVDLEECTQKGCTMSVMYSSSTENIYEDNAIDDPDYIAAHTDDSHDGYEYDSDYESTDAMSRSESDEDAHDGEREMQWYYDWLSTTVDLGSQRGEPIRALSDLANKQRTELSFPVTSDGIPDGYTEEQLEHIGGPNCTEHNAYSGYAISLEEMRGCRTAQFLVHRNQSNGNWRPDGLCEDWELSQPWFLSGLIDGMASRDMGPDKVFPARGGVSHPWADNINFDPEHMQGDEFAMPFHPWCFDIFCRQSQSRFDHINVAGLIKWRDSEFSYDDFHKIPRCAEVLSAQEQFWGHEPGSEFLAANPLHVPYLPRILQAAVEDASFDASAGVFDLSLHMSHGTSVHDPLATLPFEIQHLILGFLGSRDIANLRLASRAFQHLPNGLWYRLVREEMPWLWEAWPETECAHTPSRWTEMTANETKLFCQYTETYKSRLASEGQYSSDAVGDLLPWPRTPQIRLPRNATNWYRLYTDVRRNWGQLKGLQNRKRIWEDVEEIFARISKYSGDDSLSS